MSSLVEQPSEWRLEFPLPPGSSTSSRIPYKLLNSTGSAERGQSSVTETYLIHHSDLPSLLLLLFPNTREIGEASIYNNMILPGLANEDYPSIYTIGIPRAFRVSWGPHIDGLPVDPWRSDVFYWLPDNADLRVQDHTYGSYIRVEVEYRSMQEQDADKPRTFLDVRGNASGEYLLIMPNKAALDSTTNPNRDPQIPASVIVPQMDWTLTWAMITDHFYIETLLPKMRDAIGKVNDRTFETLYDAEAETILFMGWSYEQLDHIQTMPEVPGMIPAGETRYLQVSLSFLQKRIDEGGEIFGHQHIWDQKSGSWMKLLVDGTSSRFIYQTYDMNKLFGLSSTPPPGVL